MHAHLFGPNSLLTLCQIINKTWFPFLSRWNSSPRPDMNNKIAAFIVIEKSINTDQGVLVFWIICGIDIHIWQKQICFYYTFILWHPIDTNNFNIQCIFVNKKCWKAISVNTSTFIQRLWHVLFSSSDGQTCCTNYYGGQHRNLSDQHNRVNGTNHQQRWFSQSLCGSNRPRYFQLAYCTCPVTCRSYNW